MLELLEGLGQQLQRGFLACGEALRHRRVSAFSTASSRLSCTGSSSCDQLLDAVACGRFDVALRALAHVLEFGHGAQVLVPVILGALLGLGERLLQALELHELGRGLGQHCGRLGVDPRSSVVNAHYQKSP